MLTMLRSNERKAYSAEAFIVAPKLSWSNHSTDMGGQKQPVGQVTLM